MTISAGFEEHHRDVAVRLFWQAFQEKLSPVMGPSEKALSFLASVADPSHAISALDAKGDLLGIAGFKTSSGSFIGGDWSDMTATYGTLGSLWRAPLLSILERKLKPDTLLMDGIFVAERARGRGVGTQLLAAIKSQAQRRKLSHVRLDVIDTNPRARALYEREGFVAGEQHDLGPLRHVFGFRSATTMIFSHP